MKSGISVLTTINAASRLIMGHVPDTGKHTLPLLDALGLVVAEDQFAQFDLPPHDHSAMDGYAFMFGNGQQKVLSVCGFLPAGLTHEERVPAGQALRIMTGAPMPDGCDTVVPFENLRLEDNKIDVLSPFSVGDNVRHKGEDIRQGELLLNAGTLLRPQEVALLA